ncbi:FAP7 [Candida oxycetoniae]|uniref:Adenylate kinase isoenzyme 6 homolog n=1 Tax=Candida oxycetoniae TaxID=497107 RepID=A0AAI9SZA9_9ASCO|nr:FAP7 [Candida oxycetoniae]KAI3405371.1 FAP7 [Candida oxycetoniae]
MSRRYKPNVIVTGTPGCGKSSHSRCLVDQLNQKLFKEGTVYHFQHFNISEIAKERDCIESYDKKRDTSVVDEDRLLDTLEPDLEKGGIVIDWHCCDIFPERLIDLVIVLRCDNSKLYDRLKKRNYKDAKIQENLDCEIMEVILNEARDSYIPDIVIELKSDTAEEMDENVDRITLWVENWIKDHPKGVTNELEGGKTGGDEEEGFNSEEEDQDDDDDEDAAFRYDDDEADEVGVEDGLEEGEKYNLERAGEDEEQARENDEEETNEAVEHAEDIAQ